MNLDEFVSENNAASVSYTRKNFRSSTLANTPASSLSMCSEDCLPTKSGWLKKRSTGVFKRWQWRFFVLRDKVLKYFHDLSKTLPAAVINFEQVDTDLERISSTELLIVLSNSKRKFHVKAKPQDIARWVEALKPHIQCSLGKLEKRSSLSLKKNFWKYSYISEKQFRNEASTGDILLFQSKNLTAKLQRGLTGSKYDHVAMILRYSSEKIGFLEATGATGVAIVLWDDFLSFQWHLLYSKLVLRKLNIVRNQENISKFEDFIDKVQGKNYRLTPNKILRRSKNVTPGEEKSYFCSELIASAYKALGILPQDVPSCHYFPGKFASESLPLINCALGEELLIDFSL